MTTTAHTLTIGDLARRTGLSVSAIRFYEEKGMLQPHRTRGNQRRYLRSDIRRLSFVLIAQRLGFPLDHIAWEMSQLPGGRAPTQEDWQRISGWFRAVLDTRIATMERMRTHLDGCIGCGCLSLERCALANPEDLMGRDGPGPRFVLDEA
jgi:MerR family transcriptional regulator, redox-sensitive transcriptional activator SoxR